MSGLYIIVNIWSKYIFFKYINIVYLLLVLVKGWMVSKDFLAMPVSYVTRGIAKISPIVS